MDRPPLGNLLQPIPRPDPVPRGHRRQHRLHDEERRHGAIRYEVPAGDAHDEAVPRAGSHAQYYQFHWETVNDRWIWLRPNWEDRTRARCIACHSEFGANSHTLQGHERSRRHIRLLATFTVPIDDEFDHHLTFDEFKNEEARIKILLSAYFANDGVAYRKINTLLPLIKEIARYPGVLQEVKFNRWDLSKINSRVIAPIYKQQLAETLSQTKFSILFDESTGVDNDKHGCLLVRFSDHRSYKIRTVIWDLIPIYREDREESDETAATLYDLITDSLHGVQIANEENRVPLPQDNLISSGTDGCNSMVGVNNSVSRRLRDNYPGLNHITCPCHGCHLCGVHSLEECPVILQLLVDVYNWFCSSKRMHALKQNQIGANLEVHKILRYVTTRWLTGLPAIIRVEEQMLAIDATLAENPNNPQAMNLLMLKRSPIIRCLIPFFIFIWEVVEDLNGWLQTEEVILPEVFARITDDFKDILSCYMDPDYVQNANLLEIDTEDATHFVADNDMRIGIEARQLGTS